MRQIALTLACLLLAAPPLQAAEVPAHIAAAVAAPERSDKDRERDARDKPAELMAFTGVEPGMKVADVFGGGGYWTELFARAVGTAGSVTLVNNSPYWNLGKDDLKTRFTDSRLKNARPRVVETRALDLGSGQYDLIVIFMSYHDLYWVEEEGGWPAIDADGFLKQLHTALKPGGRLLIVDHSAMPGSGKAPAQELHRIDEAFAKQDITSHGFELEKTWDGYRNPGDDLSKNVFDPAVRGKTDRFTQLYRRR
ncbi:MAG: class I SAM-dependent methyltransferase [Steroidobacteraceae bacterium]